VTINVNGEPLALEVTDLTTLGEALSAIDELLETAGSIIVGLKVDGAELDPDRYPDIRDRPLSAVDSVDVDAQPIAAIKSKALRTLLELVALAGESAQTETSADWPALAAGLDDLSDAFAGLFSADELSFVQSFANLVEKAAGAAPDGGLRAEIGAGSERLGILFKERLDEIESPVEEMHKTAALYAAQAEELKQVPVLLQTGKDERAMHAVLVFIEIFNKVIRLVPELRGTGLDPHSLTIGGQGLSEFYTSFNEVLKQLSTAFENKDSVLIGDLAEYEVAPRMADFFTAIEGAMEAK
jgi:hypothetical protein